MTQTVLVALIYASLTWPLAAENIALNKSAYQIGRYGGASADKAVDGQYDKDNRDNEYYLRVCARTDTQWHGEVAAVWFVDLEDTYSISEVTVYNTYDKNAGRLLNNFAVDVVRSDNKTRQSCGVYNRSEPVSGGGFFTTNCGNVQGRYVYIRKLEGMKQKNIVLCEVEIDGFLGSDLAPMSSTLSPTSTATPTSSPTPTTTPTPSPITTSTPTPTPLPTQTATPTSSPTPTATPVPSPITTSTPTPTPLPTPTPTPTPSPIMTSTPTPTPSPTPTATPTPSPIMTSTPTPTPLPTPRTTPTPSPTTTPTPSPITTSTPSPKQTTTPTPTTTTTPSPATTTTPSRITPSSTLGPLIDIPLRDKQTNQTGIYAGLTSDKAIDGIFYNTGDYQQHCAHPLNPTGQAAEWWIDLGKMYKIDSVTLYNTGNVGGYFRMADFALRVYSPGVESPVTCAKYEEEVGMAANITLKCQQNVYGQYVQFIRLGGRDIDKVTICEVEIKGQLYPGCPTGYYGQNCHHRCGMCSDVDPDVYNPCDITGTCVNGCQIWWITDVCKSEIAKPNYTGQDLSLKKSSSDELQITVEQLNISSALSQYYGYKVTYGSDRSTIVMHKNNKSDIVISLTELRPNTEYTIEVQPFRVIKHQYDYGKAYPEQVYKTKCGAPDPPTFQGDPRNSSTEAGRFEIIITYTVPNEIRCDNLTSIQFHYHLDSDEQWTSLNASLSQDNLVIKHLDPGTYVIKMSATNNQGLTSYSKNVSIPIEALKSTPESNTTTVVSAVITCVLVIVALIAGALFVYRRKFKKNKESDSGLPSPSIHSDDGEINQIVVDQSEQSTDEEHSDIDYVENENTYINTVIPMSEFENYMKMKTLNTGNVFHEYKMLPGIQYGKYEIAITDDNKKKNRYNNIFPYDENRVILEEGGPNSGGDYINASFIKGYGNKEKAYIATQGVKPETIYHFWEMVWQYNVNRIVMLTNLVEENKRKCFQYWPNMTGQSEEYKDYMVSCNSVTNYADYVVSKLIITKRDESRIVFHFHFTSWKDKSKPMFGPFTLRSFLRKVHSVDGESTGPLVVHCSAGVGRTGTFIALDILLEQMANKRVIDIFGCITKLRQQRMHMVQTKDQYIFLHEAMLEVILTGETTYPCSTLAEELTDIYEDNGTGESELDRQFKILCKLKNKEEDQNKEGLSKENKHKNRLSDVVPAECDRPYLSTPDYECNHYINAIYVDSFRKHHNFIVTQMPLPHTQGDFWRLVYDHRIKCVIMLNELENSDKICEQYWPEEGTEVYGPIKVQLMATAKTLPSVTMREFMVDLAQNDDESEHSSSKPLNVRHYQLLDWSKNDTLPSDRGTFLSLIEEMHRWQEQQKHSQDEKEKDKIVIHCLNGVTRSGLFCGASHVIEQIKMNNEVDAFLAARYVSIRRPQFFQTQEEYKFLYDIALVYMSRNHEYVNFC